MKILKVIFFLCLVTLSHSVLGQWNTNGVNLTTYYRVGIGVSTVPNTNLYVSRGAGANGTAVFAGTDRDSHFNYHTNEHTYIRGGKYGSHVLLNDNGGNVGIRNKNPNATLHVSRGNSAGGTAIFAGTSSSSFFNYANDEHTYIRGGKANSKVLLNDNGGKVAVGTTATPSSVGGVNISDYRLYVKGGILTEEIRVRTVWADYVFADDYELHSLEELESFIQENKHLPNIPSESEVLEQGVAVGNMLKLQQEKIEELYLYIIEQNKRINQLEKKLESVQPTNH